MRRRAPRSTQSSASAASEVYKRQCEGVTAHAGAARKVEASTSDPSPGSLRSPPSPRYAGRGDWYPREWLGFFPSPPRERGRGGSHPSPPRERRGGRSHPSPPRERRGGRSHPSPPRERGRGQGEGVPSPLSPLCGAREPRRWGRSSGRCGVGGLERPPEQQVEGVLSPRGGAPAEIQRPEQGVGAEQGGPGAAQLGAADLVGGVPGIAGLE